MIVKSKTRTAVFFAVIIFVAALLAAVSFSVEHIPARADGQNVEITLSVLSQSKVKTYGDDDPAVEYEITSGVFAGDDGQGFLPVFTRQKGEAVGEYEISLDLAASTVPAGYDIVLAPEQRLSISKRPISLAVASGSGKTYGDADGEIGIVVSSGSLAFSDYIYGSGVRTTGETVGKYNVYMSSISILDGNGTMAISNYTLSFDGVDAYEIKRREINVSADYISKEYGDVDPVLTHSLTGGSSLRDGDFFDGSLQRAPGETPPATLLITKGSLTVCRNDGTKEDVSENYTVNFIPNYFEIKKRTLSLAVDAVTVTYGDTVDGFICSPSGTTSLASTDYIDADLYTDAGVAAGTYDVKKNSITIFSFSDEDVTAHYDISFSGTDAFTITKREITITVDGKSKLYGDDDPDLSYAITEGSLAYSDSLLLVLSRLFGETVGGYRISGDGDVLISGDDGDVTENYEISLVSGELVIEKKPLSIAVSAINNQKFYGDDTEYEINYTAGTLAFDDYFSGGLTRAIGAMSGGHEAAGDYTVYLAGLEILAFDGTDAIENYDIAFDNSFTYTVDEVVVTVTFGENKKYPGQADPTTYNYEVVGVLSGHRAEITVSRAPGETVGSYAFSIDEAKIYTDGLGEDVTSNYDILLTPADFVITQTVLTEDTEGLVIAEIPDVIFSGSPNTPDVEITYNGTTLVDGTDYTLTHSSHIYVGNATATITFKGFYTGVIAASFVIKPAPLVSGSEGLSVSVSSDVEYVYGGVEPLPEVVYKGTQLVKDVDYTVSYLNNKNKGRATVTVSFIWCYSGAVSKTFDIYAKALSDDEKAAIAVRIDEQLYTGSAVEPRPVSVLLGDEAVGYEVNEYINNIDAGTAKIVLRMNENYSGTIERTFVIRKREIIITAENKDVYYGGADAELTFKVTGALIAADRETLSGGMTRAAGTAVGSYVISGSYSHKNYIITFVEGAYRINPAVLTVKATDVSRKQGESNPTLTYTVTGFVNGEDESVLTAFPTVSVTATEDSAPGKYAIKTTGGAAANYEFKHVMGTLTVLQTAPEGTYLKVLSRTSESIVLVKINGAEYSCDGGLTWQDENAFFGLEPGKTYHLAARYKSSGIFIATEKGAVTLSAKTGLSGGAIAGIVCGAVGGAVLIAAVVVVILVKKEKIGLKKKQDEAAEE